MSQDETKITILISSDKMQATLQLDQSFNSESLATESIIAQALAQAIQHSQSLNQRAEEAVEAYRAFDFSKGKAFRFLIAEGTPPYHGKNQAFQLSPELQLIHDQAKTKLTDPPEIPEAEDAAEGEPEALDHRERTAFMIVKAGQKIGQVTHPTPGSDGVDVCGNNVPAKPGKSGAVSLDQNSVSCHNDGAVYAKVAGRVAIDGKLLSISPTLTINGAVDYSTGNIDFPGNIVIAGGIKDGFEVQSGKTISANGLVEAATLTSSRDVILKVGMSGRDKGSIFAARDLTATYLDKCSCEVGRDLIVENDICDCRIIVSHETKSPTATLMGGELSSLKDCQLKQVGTDAGTKTILTLGRVPDIDRMINHALEIVEECRSKAQECRNKVAELNADPDLSPAKAEMLTQLQFEEAEHEGKIKPLMDCVREALASATSDTPKLIVHDVLCQNSELRIGGLTAVVTQDVPGPIEIWNDENEILCKDITTGETVPANQFATISKTPSSFTHGDLPEELRSAA